jgi:predicted RecA/RadA family phage recombinase
MATNYKYSGDNVPVTAPYAVNSGDGVKVGNLYGVAMTQAASAAAVAIATTGVFAVNKTTGASTSYVAGANVHWDDTGRLATVSATSNIKIGVALVAASNTDTTVEVRLTGAW